MTDNLRTTVQILKVGRQTYWLWRVDEVDATDHRPLASGVQETRWMAARAARRARARIGERTLV